MEMNFENWTIREFNDTFGTELTNTMTFDEAMTHIENEEINYFYTSMHKDDVLEAIEAEKEIAEQLDLSLLYITNLGIYIATHQ